MHIDVVANSPGTVHLPFFIIVSTAFLISGCASPTSKTYSERLRSCTGRNSDRFTVKSSKGRASSIFAKVASRSFNSSSIFLIVSSADDA